MSLPSHYLITPAVDNETEFLAILETSLHAGIKLMQLRSKGMTLDAYEALAKKVITLAHANDCKVLLTSNANMVEKLGADGLHLDSHALKNCENRPLPAPYLIAASGHDQTALNKAQAIGASFALLSQVQYTPAHPDLEPLGWERFGQLAQQTHLPVFALGGVKPENEADAIAAGGQGVAGTKGYWKTEQNHSKTETLQPCS